MSAFKSMLTLGGMHKCFCYHTTQKKKKKKSLGITPETVINILYSWKSFV